MKAINNFLGVVLGLALLAALLAGGYFLVKYAVGVFGRLDPQLATVTAIASVVALICAAIIANGLKSQDNETGNHDEKAQLYQQLLYALCPSEPSEREDSDAEVEHLRLKQRLALYGSPGVITAYAELERHLRQKESHGAGVQPLLKQLVMEMRKDLGQTKLNIKHDDLLYLLIGK
ncbi:hypothetical protein MUO98_01475 [Candidatus Bathyarchaeota archaeon]|nr:hypothetical protein [Candidatus Bathyarchaeota archaeon]